MMRNLVFSFLLVFHLFFVSTFVTSAQTAPASPGPIRFRITPKAELLSKSTSGRLVVFMVQSAEKPNSLIGNFDPRIQVAGSGPVRITPGQALEVNPDATLAFPQAFSKAPAGKYFIQAWFDSATSPTTGPDQGDLVSAITPVDNLNPASTTPVELSLTDPIGEGQPFEETDSIQLVEFQSPMLSAFWGHPMTIRAGVVLPPSYLKNPKRSYPTVYNVHGFGGNHFGAKYAGPKLLKGMTDGKYPEMIHVFLDASFVTGHHVFADSVNNGPWGRALTEEFIPYLEQNFRQIRKPAARFLTGHSSGGWSTLWLQITYPDFFGGTWSTSPDPVDFRSFSGINATPGTTDNLYRAADGKPHPLVRMGGQVVFTIEAYTLKEEIETDGLGGQLSSFEWVFSPKDRDGRPMKLFDRTTGEFDQRVLKAWQKYDIRLTLEKNWATLGPKLAGKIHIVCGEADTFYLEGAVRLLRDFLKEKGSDAVVELVPGRNHFDLYNPFETYKEGLETRIFQEMETAFQSASKSGKSKVKK